MEIHVRKAGVEDLKHILHQRRAMFEEMGFRASAVLDGVEELSLVVLQPGIPERHIQRLASGGIERADRGRWRHCGCGLAGLSR